MASVRVVLPEDLLRAAQVSPRQASAEVKKILVLYLYARGNISLAQAAEWLGISQWEFFELNKEWGLSVHYDIEDYREDKAVLATLPK
jgi:predicted HTH domain antitoxin